jgi:16S rRNA (guanine(966)-N(2))-methyltransferase RsmD
VKTGMRVIAGDMKGRRLVPVPGRSTRPTTDKVKESIFNIIGPYFEEGYVLDLFAGTGSLGIEAMSRGIAEGVFVDMDTKALQVVRKNIETCGLQERSEIFRNDARRAIQLLAAKQLQFNLVLLDPPYHLDVIPSVITGLVQHNLLNDNAIVVAEHSSERELPEQIESVARWKSVTYGEIAVSFYQKGTYKS